jgi:large subunit ribosomal protein L21
MYAVIETGGKQYRVEVGTELEVELLEAEAGQSITLDRVLLVADGEQATVGRPVVENATVAADVVRRTRGEKVVSFKYRPKARRRVTKGHRQELLLLRISDIVLDGRSAAAAVRAAEDASQGARERADEAARRQAAADAELAAKLAAKAPKAAAAPRRTPKASAEGGPAKPATRRKSPAKAAGSETDETAPAAEAGGAEAAPKKTRSTKKDG